MQLLRNTRFGTTPTVLVVIPIYRSKHPLTRNCDSSINLKYPWALAGDVRCTWSNYILVTCQENWNEKSLCGRWAGLKFFFRPMGTFIMNNRIFLLIIHNHWKLLMVMIVILMSRSYSSSTLGSYEDAVAGEENTKERSGMSQNVDGVSHTYELNWIARPR